MQKGTVPNSTYGYPIEEFYQKFISCDVSRQFSAGNPRYLVGMSGAELTDSVVEDTGGTVLKENDGTYSVGSEDRIIERNRV